MQLKTLPLSDYVICERYLTFQEFITADKHEYHKEHFCCWECDGGLGGTKYVSHKGQPYCQLLALEWKIFLIAIYKISYNYIRYRI